MIQFLNNFTGCLYQRIYYKVLLLTFKSLNGLTPNYFVELMKRTPIKRTTEDGNNDLMIVAIKHKFFVGRSVGYEGSKQWNTLPKGLRICTNINTFKKLLKTFLFGGLPAVVINIVCKFLIFYSFTNLFLFSIHFIFFIFVITFSYLCIFFSHFVFFSNNVKHYRLTYIALYKLLFLLLLSMKFGGRAAATFVQNQQTPSVELSFASRLNASWFPNKQTAILFNVTAAEGGEYLCEMVSVRPAQTWIKKIHVSLLGKLRQPVNGMIFMAITFLSFSICWGGGGY